MSTMTVSFGFTEVRPTYYKAPKDSEFYTVRALRETPNYFRGVGQEPLKPLGAITNIAHGTLKATSDLLRLPQGEDRKTLNRLEGATRTKESTIDAATGIVGGAGTILRGKPIKGVAKMAGGVVDALDIVPSAIADMTDQATGANSNK